RLWATLAIDQLEREGKGDDRPRIVALSQGYGVMSRETSLLVLEPQAMFDAFGVDRSQPAATWTGEEDIDETTSQGTIQVAKDVAPAGRSMGSAPMPKPSMAKGDWDRNEMAPSADMELDSGSIRGGGGAGTMAKMD